MGLGPCCAQGAGFPPAFGAIFCNDPKRRCVQSPDLGFGHGVGVIFHRQVLLKDMDFSNARGLGHSIPTFVSAARAARKAALVAQAGPCSGAT
jgi:hypothetical protein